MIKENQILNKDHLKIIVTDSGLGGLSVHALLDKELRKRKLNLNIEIIYFNALADHNYGYNTMSSKNEKLRVFEQALSGMLKFEPDIILIACNTLSVLYQFTEISKKIKIPVISIVDIGIDMVLQNINRNNNFAVIIFGTETTINSNTYQNSLVEKGVKISGIINQKCNNLESEIQLNPLSSKVNNLIEKYVDESARKINNSFNRIFALLACTHYGYSESIFIKKLTKQFGKSVTILNPNEQMAKQFNSNVQTGNLGYNRIKHKIYSKVEVYDSEISNLSHLLAQDSEEVTKAFKNYIYEPNLFSI